MIRNVDTAPYPAGGLNPKLLIDNWAIASGYARKFAPLTSKQAHPSRLANS